MIVIKEVNTTRKSDFYLNTFKFNKLSKIKFTKLRNEFNMESPETNLVWIESVWRLFNSDYPVSKNNIRSSYSYFDWVHLNYIFYIEDIIKKKKRRLYSGIFGINGMKMR